MARSSAGILLHRRTGSGPADVELLLVHPGGPFWTGKDEHAWSIPKGEYDPATENPRATAAREFAEELGSAPPGGGWLDLGEVRQPGGKRVIAFAVEGDLEPDAIVSGTFDLEWPPRSGRSRSFPEVDRAAWVSPDAARRLLHRGQVALVDRLLEVLAAAAP